MQWTKRSAFVYQETNGSSQFYEVQMMQIDISVQQIFPLWTYH